MTKEKFKKVCNTAKEEIINYYSNEELQEILDTSQNKGALYSEEFYECYSEEIDEGYESCYDLNWKDHAKSKLDCFASFIESVALDAVDYDDNFERDNEHLN